MTGCGSVGPKLGASCQNRTEGNPTIITWQNHTLWTLTPPQYTVENVQGNHHNDIHNTKITGKKIY